MCVQALVVAEICSSWILSCLPTEMFVVFLKLWAAFFFAHIAMICPTTHPPPAPLTELQVLSNYFASTHKKIFTTSNGASILNFVHSRHSPRVFFSINAAVCSALFPYNHTLTVCLLCILLHIYRGRVQLWKMFGKTILPLFNIYG